MAKVIQKKGSSINFINSDAPVGEQIIISFPLEAIARPIQGKSEPTIEIDTPDGLKSQQISLTGLNYQDDGGSITPWGGTVDELIDKLNNEYLVPAISLEESKTDIAYYFVFSGPIPFPDDITDNVLFNYNDGSNLSTSFDDGGALIDTYTSMDDFITALNAEQDVFVFYELSDEQLQRTNQTNTTIGVRSGTRTIPENFTSDLYIEWGTGINIDGGIQVLYPNNSSQDQTTSEIVQLQNTLNSFNYPIGSETNTDDKAILTRPTNYAHEIAKGKISGSSNVNKFGYNSDIDSSAAEVLSSFGGTFNIMTTGDTLSVVSTSAADSAAGTGGRSILIGGIDENFEAQTEILTLNGTTPVNTLSSWLGVNRVFLLSSGTSNTNEVDIVLSDTSGTVGVQAQIPIGASVTQQCIYHTQINHSLLVDYFLFNCIKVSGGGGNPEVIFKIYSYSRVTDTNYEVLRQVIDTQQTNTITLQLNQPLTFTGREVIYITVETDVNNTAANGRFSGVESLNE